MSTLSTPSVPVPNPRRSVRPPRIAINPNATHMGGGGGQQSSMPYTAQTYGSSVGHPPNWPPYSNPFNNVYSNRASTFMSKGLEGFVDFTKSGMSFGEKFSYGMYNKIGKWSKKWFTHIFLFLVVVLYSVGGAFLFMVIEGKQAKLNSDRVQGIQKDFFYAIQNIANDRELLRYNPNEWNGKVIGTLRAHKDALDTMLPNNKTMEELKLFINPWTFWNSMFYCGTIYTTIGYGHIAPQTTLGRSLTIGYAIIGIPMFLILLADFGKLFTRCIKFVWAYIRRVYYTGTCRKVRKNQQMQDMMKGINTVYDVAIRRPSQFIRDIDIENQDKKDKEAETPGTNLPSQVGTETPTSPYPETFEIDDEFNLPVSVASTILILYIIFGALIYALWEEWTYFESFYFVFISMSTIGFGDFVPNHPIFMMCTILYLLFGLALTSMFINVVQIKLSDSFKQASAKIGATIGLSLAEEELSRNSQMGTPVSEVPSVHLGKIPESSSPTDIAGDGGVYDNYQKNKNNDDEPPVLLPRSPRQPPQGQNEEETKRKKKFFNFK